MRARVRTQDIDPFEWLGFDTFTFCSQHGDGVGFLVAHTLRSGLGARTMMLCVQSYAYRLCKITQSIYKFARSLM